MKNIMTKPLAISLAIILCLTLTSTALAAAFLYKTTLPAKANLVKGSPGLELYSDSDGTTELTSFDFGHMAIGGADSKTIYVKNIGDETQRISAYSDDLPREIGYFRGYSYTDLEPSELIALELSLTIEDDAPKGLIGFTVTVEGSPPKPAPAPPTPAP